MKKFTKIALGIAAFFAILGICCIGASFAMGISWDSISDMIQKSELITQNLSEYDSSQCKNMDIDFAAGSLSIYYDDVDEIEVHQEGSNNLSCRMDGNTLRIKSKQNWIFHNSKGDVRIVIPRDFYFEEVDMEIAAGQVDVQDLRIKSLEIEVGAGQANLVDVDVQYLAAATGAGQIQAKLLGAEDDYNYDVECGIGEIVIGQNHFESIGKETNLNHPGAERKLEIECGVGQVIVEFQE